MQHSFNKVTYGNLTQSQLLGLQKKCIADDVLPVLEKKYSNQLAFPKNDSDSTKSELNEIVKQIKVIKEDENSKYLTRYKQYDRSLKQSIISSFQLKGIDVRNLVLSVFDDVSPTILKLKQKYQRPRPYQLAQYYKLKLFPFDTFTGHSPSYPSGHTLQAYCTLNILANKYPKAYQFCKNFIDDVAYSRVYLGLHFPSDNDASYLIGREILKLKSVTEKYEI